MSELLQIKNLRGGYKDGFNILNGIDLTIKEGETLGIIGLNGSGKSTLGKAIMNMIPFRNGEIVFNGEEISGLPTYELVNKGLSFMQQGGVVFPNLSVWENIELAFSSGIGATFEQLRDIIPMLQQPQKILRHQMADKLSGGQKHQLALAIALATRPKLVILDEPSAGLSPKSVEEMYDLLQIVHERMMSTIILIEQNVSKAVSFCQRSILLQTGKIVHTFDHSNSSEIDTILFKNLIN